ncbi:putative lipid-binding protein AIR1 [Oryza sativa Japonica Group]
MVCQEESFDNNRLLGFWFSPLQIPTYSAEFSHLSLVADHHLRSPVCNGASACTLSASVAMASRAFLLVALNLVLFFTVASACGKYCPTPSTPSTTPSTPSYNTKCPKNALKFAACADVLGLVSAEVGQPPYEPCCGVLGGLADLEAAVCLCTAIKANVLGITLDIPVKLSLLVNYCGKNVPSGFICA